ncbi:hypothetical protein BH23BAC1_BH23BAC1_17950 [soil metagenome]
MPQIPIQAYYYNKKEQDFIRNHLVDLHETDSFILGSIETSDIQLLKTEGILFDILMDTSLVKGAIPKSLPSGSFGKNLFIYQVDPTGTGANIKKNYFLIRLKGPLLEIWKKVLISEKIEILENLQNSIYKVYTTHNLTFLQSLDFIQSARPFQTADTEVVMKRSLLSDFDLFEPESEKIAIYDIRLQRGKAESLLHFLKNKEIEILDSTQNKIRVRLSGATMIAELSHRDEVEAIEEFIRPKLHNDKARSTIHLDSEVENDYRANVPYNGEGQIIGVADTGIDLKHPDFEGRIHKVVARGRINDPSDPHGHGTHVAGSVLGSGKASDGRIKGIAPKARLFFQSVLDNEGGLGGLPLGLHDLFQEAYDEDVRIHNNSWGALAESEYRFNSLEVDEYVYSHKDMLIVISGGNEGSAFQPRNSNPGFVDWLSLGSPATAKNALTVGASRSMRTEGGFAALTYGQAWPDVYPEDPMRSEKISGDVECIAGFSSRGPCGNESRIKPDVVAPGTDIASAKSSLAPTVNFWGPYPKNRKYAFMGGTSMSAPIVTGFAALVREYFIKERLHKPSAALLKAAIINGTRKLQGKDALADHAFVPNFHQGFGCIDMKNTLPNALNQDLKLSFIDSWQQPKLQFNATGQRFLFHLEVNEKLPIRLCLTWTDPPGRGLQNNLNLFLMHKEKQFKWTGNEEIPRTITAFDRDNNVEVIRIDEPLSGEYIIAVQAANILFNPQDFALIVTGFLTSPLKQL